jgi:hypothetical protein
VIYRLGFSAAPRTLVILKINWDAWQIVSTTEPGEMVEQYHH